MERLKVLDGLRAIAVLIVMLSHAGLGKIIPGGFGVTIFFCLSGFLITTLMRIEREKTGTVSFRGFYLRRTVRIIPPMLICYLVAVALVYSGAIDRPMLSSGIKWDLLFLTNYAPPLVPNSMIPIPLWSLDVEEHFYLTFPLIFLLILRARPSLRWLAMSALLALALAIRVVEYKLGNASHIYYWSHTRFDSILFGVLLTVDLARPKKDGKDWSISPLVFAAAIGAILLTFVIRDDFFRETIRYSIQGIGLFLIFKFLIKGEPNFIGSLLGSKPLKVVADYSYVLYLIHLPFLMAAEHMLPGLPVVVRYLIAFTLAFAFAAAMHRYVEQPLLRWRQGIQRGWQPRPSLQPKGVE